MAKRKRGPGRPKFVSKTLTLRVSAQEVEVLRCLAHWGLGNDGPCNTAEAIRRAIHVAHEDMHDRSCRKCPRGSA